MSTPNLFNLHCNTLHVTYAATGIDGKPHLTYQDAHQSLNFSGDQIRCVETEIGTQVSVSIRQTVDTGSTTFTLVLPRVNLDATNGATIRSFGITTLHRRSPIPAFNHGQLDLYSVELLQGTAQFVVF